VVLDLAAKLCTHRWLRFERHRLITSATLFENVTESQRHYFPALNFRLFDGDSILNDVFDDMNA
jgi:hypothetical protein